jgi:uncharacterized protein (TIGR02145 family)
MAKYGTLYNYVAVSSGKLCPSGWRVPSDDDWKTLEKYLGMTATDADAKTWRGTDQGAQLKSTTGWGTGNGTNTTGFSAVPSGFRTYNEMYVGLGVDGYWWTASPEGTDMAWVRGMSMAFPMTYRDIFNQGSGLAVRCIKN